MTAMALAAAEPSLDEAEPGTATGEAGVDTSARPTALRRKRYVIDREVLLHRLDRRPDIVEQIARQSGLSRRRLKLTLRGEPTGRAVVARLTEILVVLTEVSEPFHPLD